MKPAWFALLLSSVLVVPSIAAASPGDPSPDPGARRGERHGRLERVLRRRAHRRHAMRCLRALELGDAERQAIRSAREASAGARDALREQVRAILEDARGERTSEARKAAREKVKAAVEAARTAVEPQAKAVFDSLTSEQRAKLLEAVAKRKGTASDADVVRRLARMLLAPRGPRGRAGR
jgi:hypothetical protein